MNRRCALMASVAVALVCQAAGALAADGPRTAVVKLPAIGRASAAIGPLQKTLESAGFKTTVPLALASVSSVQPAPTLVVIYQTEVVDDAEATYLREAVKQGMGLVYLFGTATERIDAANAFLKETGLQVSAGAREGRNVQIAAHDIVPGVAETPAPRIGLSLDGRDMQVIGVQKDRPLVGGVAFGKGRVVALPVDVLSGDRASEPPTAETLALMAGCARWASGLAAAQVPVVTADQPGNVKPLPGGKSNGKPAAPVAVEAGVQVFGTADDFSGKALVDLGAADDGWPVIAQTLAPALQLPEASPLGLKTTGVKEPLLAPLRTGPALVVLGSCREFTDGEAVALTQYVNAGGRLLMLAHASDATVLRLVPLNNVLLGFGIVAGMGRDHGPAAFSQSPAAQGVANPGEVPSGVKLSSSDVDALATVKNVPFAMAGQLRSGRFVVADCGGLLVTPPKGKTANPARDAYVEFLRGLIAWVTAK